MSEEDPQTVTLPFSVVRDVVSASYAVDLRWAADAFRAARPEWDRHCDRMLRLDAALRKLDEIADPNGDF